MPRNPADFMQDFIAAHVDAVTPAGSIDRLVVECIAAARVEGLSPAEILDETGSDVRTLIADAVEHQLGV